MKTSAGPSIRSEGRLLYTLLDAAADSGRLPEPTRERWREVKNRIIGGASYEHEAEALHEMMVEIDTARTLAGTWIETRWQTLESRVLTTA